MVMRWYADLRILRYIAEELEQISECLHSFSDNLCQAELEYYDYRESCLYTLYNNILPFVEVLVT